MSGVTFEDAWELAWRQVVWPHDTSHRRQWKTALRETRLEWAACYYEAPTTAHGNMVVLAAALLPRDHPQGEVNGMLQA